MNDSRLPKAVFYGELTKGKRGGQQLRYKDVVKRHLKATHITVDHWETLAQDRQQWRQAIHKGKGHIGEKIQQKYQHDHNLRHGLPGAPPLSSSVSTAGEVLNLKLDYSLTNSLTIGHDGQQRERESLRLSQLMQWESFINNFRLMYTLYAYLACVFRPVQSGGN